ncbi:MAG: hypothetical protein AB1531_05440 [Chloroflexota bacterium]
MPEMTIKEWAAAYRANNEAEREMLKQELPLMPPKDGILRYFRLCEFLVRLSPDAREVFADERRRHYLDLEERLRKAAKRLGYDFPG